MRTAAALALALVALTVGMEVVDEVSAEGDLASMAMLQEASAANMAKTGGLDQYRPDGLNDVELSAIANRRIMPCKGLVSLTTRCLGSSAPTSSINPSRTR